ncbi:MAG: hypothetical protein J5610_01970 [Prevotella sp.]|nr:hypothetical protein [Prevotella sp.]
MKAYIKPTIIVVRIKAGHLLLPASPNGYHDEYSDREELSKQGFMWEEEDE